MSLFGLFSIDLCFPGKLLTMMGAKYNDGIKRVATNGICGSERRDFPCEGLSEKFKPEFLF
jgi:hypothetical protein